MLHFLLHVHKQKFFHWALSWNANVVVNGRVKRIKAFKAKNKNEIKNIREHKSQS